MLGLSQIDGRKRFSVFEYEVMGEFSLKAGGQSYTKSLLGRGLLLENEQLITLLIMACQ